MRQGGLRATVGTLWSQGQVQQHTCRAESKPRLCTVCLRPPAHGALFQARKLRRQRASPCWRWPCLAPRARPPLGACLLQRLPAPPGQATHSQGHPHGHFLEPPWEVASSVPGHGAGACVPAVPLALVEIGPGRRRKFLGGGAQGEGTQVRGLWKGGASQGGPVGASGKGPHHKSEKEKAGGTGTFATGTVARAGAGRRLDRGVLCAQPNSTASFPLCAPAVPRPSAT